MENAKGSFIKIDRSILDWRWYKNGNTMRLFLHLLLKANWKDASFEEYEIKRGSFVTSLQTLASETGLTVQQTRTALEHLQKKGEITIKSTNKFTIVTIVKYWVFQDVPNANQQANQQTSNKQITNKQQTNNKQVTTIEEYKEYKEREEGKEEAEPLTSLFDSAWKEIIALYPRCKGLELESKEKYFKVLEEQADKEKFLEDTKEAIKNYVERYRKENDNDLTYILGFNRFFSECLQKEMECYQSQEVVPMGWQKDEDKTIPRCEFNEEFKNKYDHKDELKYIEVLKEIYRKYPIRNFIVDAYEPLYFGIVNRYEDGKGANLLYASMGRYLEDMESKKQYFIPELAYWLKYEAIEIMETITDYKKLIPESEDI